MLLIIVLVCFVVVMLLWVLAKMKAITADTDVFAFIACLLLGIAVFLVGHVGNTWR